MSNSQKQIKTIVFIAIYVAITLALDVAKESLGFLEMPQGGSINIALIPVVLASFHLGPMLGMAVGAIWMIAPFIIMPSSFYFSAINMPLGVLCDYIIPSVIIGAASFIFIKKENIFTMEAGIVITMLIRIASLVASGVYAWPNDVAAGSKEALIGSLSYNLPYSLATMAVLMVVVPLIYKALAKQMKAFK